MTSFLVLFCHDCADERPFEQPECVDGHGADCIEWCCTECGGAVLVGMIVAEPAPDAQAVGNAA